MKNISITCPLSCLLLFLSFLMSCSQLNEQAIFLDDSGEHLEGWLQGGHQNAVIEDMSQCLKCHGSDFLGGITGVSCGTCHTEATAHPIPWIEDGHGKAAIHNLSVCALCHGSDFRGGSTGISCFSCHDGPYGFGHPAGWETDHSLEAKKGTTGCATETCHGEDYRGGHSGVSCYGCHLGGPSGRMHPEDWSYAFVDHRRFLKSNGKNASSCAFPYCHGVDLTGGMAPPNGSWPAAPSCYTCHGKKWNVP